MLYIDFHAFFKVEIVMSRVGRACSSLLLHRVNECVQTRRLELYLVILKIAL